MKLLIDDAFKFNVMLFSDICLDGFYMVYLIIFQLSFAVFHNRAPQHEVLRVVRKMLAGICNIFGEFIRQFLNIIRTIVFDILKPGCEMNSDFAEIHPLIP